jgi:hypothetical protein
MCPAQKCTICILPSILLSKTMIFRKTPFPVHKYRLFESNLQNVSSRFTKKTVFPLKSFRGGGKRCNLIYHREKIVGLTMLQHCIVPRYDTILSLSGKTRTEKTLRHSFSGQMDAIAHTTCARKEPKKRCFYNYKA